MSLLASATELVCALGLGDRLVGRSHECDYPEWVHRLPVVSRPTFDITGSSRDIDQRVRDLLGRGEPLYAVDDTLLASLAPDVIITQTHCEVCAVGPSNLAHGVPGLRRERTVSLDGGTLDGVLADFVKVAQVLGVEDRGAILTTNIRERMTALGTATSALPRRRVACLEWTDPVFAMGNWGPELVALAGGESVLGIAGAHSTTTPWEDVIAADPDVLIVAPCGFGLARALADMPAIVARPGFHDLRAVRNGEVYVADGNLYFNRSGPSLFETPEILVEIVHPSVAPTKHEGISWKKYD